MLRYLIKTLLQMHLFSDTARSPNNGSDPLYNESLPLNGSLLDWGNFSGFNGSRPRLEDAAPRIVEHPSDLIVSKGEPATLNCKAEGRPSPTVEWYKDGERVETARDDPRSHRMLLPSGSLFFLRIVHGRRSKPDEGVYVCVARNYLGEALSRNASLEVAMPPQIVVRPRDQITAPGRTVTFLCGTKGNPPPAVFWQREGSQILLFPVQEPSQAGRFSVSLSGELTIADVQVEDSGYYICQAISVAGSILTKALLEVESAPSDRVPPIIRQGPANHTLAPGSVAQLHCRVLGTPPPSVQWEKDGRRILGGDARLSLMQNGTLQITDLQETDSGAYTCLASSSSGETSWSGVLTVKESGESSGSQAAEPFQLPGPPHKPIVTDVSKNSVSLTWQPNAHEGGAAVTSYIIEAFSQSAGSTWQTVADMVKVETHTIAGLLPNTVYLFIVRAVNAYGLSDPSPISEPVRTQDVSPTGQGIDHRQVQRELGEVAVQLQDPVAMTAASIRVSWTVDRQSQFIQGYRLFFRPAGASWLLQDIHSPSERSTVLSGLLRGTEYEMKIRPYFDEFQGKDSRTLLVRTPEEVPSAPPRSVTVATVRLSNGTSISVSWEPPPSETQNGVIQEYRVWCVGGVAGDNQTRHSINRTVDGRSLSAVLSGLAPGVIYQLQVAAVTSAGVGTHSQPVSVLIKLPAEQPSLPGAGGHGDGGVHGDGDGGRHGDGEEGSVSLAEQITGVVKQPAFIAGIGGACWAILMGFSLWIYCRRKKRKELSHYTASFNYTPAVGFPQGEGPGLGGGLGSYPWLADSWPSPGLLHGNKEAAGCCSANHDTAERYYNEVGISNYLSQTEKFSLGGSTEGPIYSTIDPPREETPAAPYATAAIMPFTHQPPPPPSAPPPPAPPHQPPHHQPPPHGEQADAHWIQTSRAQYAQPERCSGKPRQKAVGKAVKTPSLTWMEALPPPPPPRGPGGGTSRTTWTRALRWRAVRRRAPPPPWRKACSPAPSYSHQSTATLTPSPQEGPREEGQTQTRRRPPCGPVPAPQPPGTPLAPPSPAHLDQSPAHLDQSPAHLDQSPAHLDQSPAHLDQSPAHLDQSPAHLDQSPAHLDQSHAHLDQSHAHLDQSPTPGNAFLK
ncbi:LOW QUALITY PROTEIN: roundabout homolog 3 [Menidia menidia]